VISLVDESALRFIQCFDCWLGDLTGIWPVKNTYATYPKGYRLPQVKKVTGRKLVNDQNDTTQLEQSQLTCYCHCPLIVCLHFNSRFTHEAPMFTWTAVTIAGELSLLQVILLILSIKKRKVLP